MFHRQARQLRIGSAVYKNMLKPDVRLANLKFKIKFRMIIMSSTILKYIDVPLWDFILSNNRILTSELENKKTNPIYVESHEAGANGNFTCRVTFGGQTIIGSGHPKKRAKQQAARNGVSNKS